jgi:Aerotolerance regulator N-terminal/von Willebrand factor type A domain
VLLAPFFLLGLLAVGLPLWLHRFARDTRTKQPFASLMLLEASQIHRSREHTLRYWLLLALRILLLLLLAFAFAQPMLPWRTPPLEAADRTLHVIVLDTSLSMQQGERWQHALEKARSLIDALRPVDQAMLVTADSRVQVVRGPVNQSAADELRSSLAAVKPGPARLDYGMLMTSAASWIGTGRPTTQFHFITDLQQSATPLQFADLEPPEGVKLVLEDVVDAAATNQYVKSVGPAEHDSNALEVQLGGTIPPGSQRTVILTVDGKEKARKTVTAAVKNATFDALDLGTGTHRVSVTLEPADPLPQDDQFFAVIEHREPRALIIGANSNGDDVSYFAAAVGALTSPHLSVERTGADAISQRALADYSALVVSDVGVLAGASVGAIQRYLEGGGAVLATLGPRAAQRERMPLSDHQRITSGLGNTNSSAGMRVAAVEQSHPALRDAQGWRSVRFFRYVPVEPLPGDAVLIRLEDGRPLLIERHVGAGRLLVLTSPLDRDWNDLAIHPLFVRFVGEAARYLTAAAATPNITVGSLLPTGVNGRNGAQIFDPHGRRVLALSDTAEQTRLFANVVGFYEVRGGGRSDFVAVNPDTRESDLARMPQAAVEQWRRLQTPARAANVRSANAEEAPTLKAIWPWLLLIAVTLAFVEPLVANSHLHIRRGVAT